MSTVPATCPPECQEHQANQDKSIDQLFQMAIPPWIRALFVASITTLFCWSAWICINYATRDDQKDVRSELRQEMKEIQGKLDTLLQRKP